MQFYASLADEAVSIRRASARAGCLVRSVKIAPTHESVTGVIAVGSPSRVLGRIECGDGWGGGRLLLALAIEDARTPGAQKLAAELREGTNSDEQYARAVHAYVLQRVRFERERIEEFESGGYTLELGSGDCDAHFRLVYALASAGGLHAGLALLHHGSGTPPAHAVAVVDLGGHWIYLETTVAAAFGEAPNAAARRLGLTTERSDIAKEVRIMTEKDLAPVPAGFRDRNAPAQVLLDAQALQRLGYLADDAPANLLTDPTATVLREAVLAFQLAHALVPDGLLGPTTRLYIAHALRAADPSVLEGFAYPGIGELGAVTNVSARISDEFLRLVIAMTDRFRAQGATVAAEDFLQVWTYESGISNIQTRVIDPKTGQPYSNAGINQMGETERRNCGFTGGLGPWLALSLEEQAPFVECFYKSAAQMGGGPKALRNATSCYVATFAPAHIGHSGEPNYPLYSAIGTPAQYQANRGLDQGGKQYISVDDMRLALVRVARNPLFLEVRDRVRALGAAPAVEPSPPSNLVASALLLAMFSAGGFAAWQAATS